MSTFHTAQSNRPVRFTNLLNRYAAHIRRPVATLDDAEKMSFRVWLTEAVERLWDHLPAPATLHYEKVSITTAPSISVSSYGLPEDSDALVLWQGRHVSPDQIPTAEYPTWLLLGNPIAAYLADPRQNPVQKHLTVLRDDSGYIYIPWHKGVPRPANIWLVVKRYCPDYATTYDTDSNPPPYGEYAFDGDTGEFYIKIPTIPETPYLDYAQNWSIPNSLVKSGYFPAFIPFEYVTPAIKYCQWQHALATGCAPDICQLLEADYNRAYEDCAVNFENKRGQLPIALFSNV